MLKKGAVIIVAAFAAFYVFTQPEAAADAVRGAGDAVFEAFDQVIRFFGRLFS
ncbi:MAG: hypothetical protein ACRDO1_11140 [Nocardioidaceae bacterium]